MCSPVKADLVETLFTRLVDGIEAGARVLFLPAVWVIGGIRRTAAAWDPVLGRAPNTAHQDWLSYGGLGPPCALWPGTHRNRGMHSCTDSMAEPPGAAGFYTMYLYGHRFATTLGSLEAQTQPRPHAQGRRSIHQGQGQGYADSQDHTLTLSSAGGEQPSQPGSLRLVGAARARLAGWGFGSPLGITCHDHAQCYPPLPGVWGVEGTS